VEQRRDSVNVFAAILEAMSAVREAVPPELDPIAMRREAAMRQAIRAAQDEGCQRIAVVCGAWHAPALVDLSDPKEDATCCAVCRALDCRPPGCPGPTPPGARRRLRRRDRVAGLVPAPVEHRKRRDNTLDDQRGPPAAR
jgi:chloramphenicol 3-O-phosphotransferase